MAKPTTHPIDPAALFAAIDAKRKAEGLSWRDVQLQCGMREERQAYRYRDGVIPSDATLGRFLAWLGRGVEDFLSAEGTSHG